MVRHRSCFFQRAAVLEIGGDPRRPETVVAELGGDAGRRRAPADHRIGVCLRQHGAGELAGAAADRAEQRPLGITAYLKNGGTLEKAAATANHASTRTTQLYDRRRDELSLLLKKLKLELPAQPPPKITAGAPPPLTPL